MAWKRSRKSWSAPAPSHCWSSHMVPGGGGSPCWPWGSKYLRVKNSHGPPLLPPGPNAPFYGTSDSLPNLGIWIANPLRWGKQNPRLSPLIRKAMATEVCWGRGMQFSQSPCAQNFKCGTLYKTGSCLWPFFPPRCSCPLTRDLFPAMGTWEGSWEGGVSRTLPFVQEKPGWEECPSMQLFKCAPFP